MNIFKGDLLIVLLSGGASSIVSLPTRNSSLSSIATKTRELMHHGANIHELNAFRRSVDQLKSGGLSRLVSPAQTITLMVSDVPGDVMEDIGSGPTIPEHVHVSDTDNIRYGKDRWSYPYPANVIITRNVDARTYCIDFLKSRGFSLQPAEFRLSGDARTTGRYLAGYARKIKASARTKTTCIVLGGETTVSVEGQGRGGRNLELAASFAASISGTDGIYLLTLATDGKDGSSPSCGALVNGSTLSTGGFSREDAERYLDNNDSYTLLSTCGSTIYSGPTGTNVMDIAILALC
jgi:glycerate-2-kinase